MTVHAVEQDNFGYEVNGHKLEDGDIVKYASGEVLRFETLNGPLKVKLTRTTDGPEKEESSSFESGALALDSGKDADPAGFWAVEEMVRSDLSPAEIELFQEAHDGFVSKYNYEFTIETGAGALTDAKEGAWEC